MNTFSLVFKVHQLFYLRPYRFFDIGQRHNYYDDYRNKYILKRFSERSYYKANRLMHELCDRYGERFKISFVFSGTAVDQMQWYAPELLEDFKQLLTRPNVEILAGDDSCSALAVMDRNLWKAQVERHRTRMKEVFGKCSDILAGTELLYDDQIGKTAAEMGYKGILAEGAKPVLGWKSPHVLYKHPECDLNLILRDGVLSESVSIHFAGKTSLTAPEFASLAAQDKESIPDGSHVNFYCNYATLGEYQDEESGIFEFFRHLPQEIMNQGFDFVSLSELCALPDERPALHVPFTTSVMDEEKDLTFLYANELQRDVIANWKKVCPSMRSCPVEELQKDFRFLTSVEHLAFMSTKYFTEKPSIRYLNPYDSPYDAYIDYMNIWSDFTQRLQGL
ncbi:MAG: hypothetical protein NC396_03645 [Bacteroides sp.]|nr:hypothetical protein [Bacteroides sp.]MCM1085320.1 hypothetical protein [Bacteroides sp.]